MESKVYQGDIGTEIIIAVRNNISAATDIKMSVKKPDGNTTTWNAGLKTDWVSDQNYEQSFPYAIRYFAKEGDLDQIGTFKIQGVVSLPAWSGRTGTVYLTVHEPFT